MKDQKKNILPKSSEEQENLLRETAERYDKSGELNPVDFDKVMGNVLESKKESMSMNYEQAEKFLHQVERITGEIQAEYLKEGFFIEVNPVIIESKLINNAHPSSRLILLRQADITGTRRDVVRRRNQHLKNQNNLTVLTYIDTMAHPHNTIDCFDVDSIRNKFDFIKF